MHSIITEVIAGAEAEYIASIVLMIFALYLAGRGMIEIIWQPERIEAKLKALWHAVDFEAFWRK